MTVDTAVYIYGILPGDIELEPGVVGVGDPPAEVRLVRLDGLAALVSDVDMARPLGRPEDLFAHEELLDSIVTEAPVLPMRFGAVVSSDDAVADELLAEHYDEFAAALRQLEGHVEYIIRGRYAEDAILGEVLGEDPRAARLSDQLKGADPDATRNQRIELGEIISNAVTAKRDQDTRALADTLNGHVVASVVRPPSHELDAVYVAVLVQEDAAQGFEQAVRQRGRDWEGRVELQLFGPVAAYDFVGMPDPSQAAAAGGS